MQLKISASYLAMLLVVMVLMNTYPLIVSEDLVFQAKRNALLSSAAALNTEQRVAIRDGEVVELTAKEYDLIELLMKNPRRVYSRENLMNVVWGYSYTGDYRTVDVHIRRLREKLERTPAEPDYILTKWGVGYYFKG